MNRQQNFVQLCHTNQHKLYMKILQNNSVVIQIKRLKDQIKKQESSYLQAILTKQFLETNNICNVMQLQDYLLESSYNIDQNSMQLSVYTLEDTDQTEQDQKQLAFCIPLKYGSHPHKLQINEQHLCRQYQHKQNRQQQHQTDYNTEHKDQPILSDVNIVIGQQNQNEIEDYKKSSQIYNAGRVQPPRGDIQSKFLQTIKYFSSTCHVKSPISQYRERFDKILQICVSDQQTSNATIKNMIADIVTYLFESHIYGSGSTNTNKTKNQSMLQGISMQQQTKHKIRLINHIIEQATGQKSQQKLYKFVNKNDQIQKLHDLILKIQQEIDMLKKCQKYQIENTQRCNKSLEAKLHQLSDRLRTGLNQYKISIQSKINQVYKQLQHVSMRLELIIDKTNKNFKQIQDNSQTIAEQISQDNKKLFQLLTLHCEQNTKYKKSGNKVENLSEQLPLKISIKIPMIGLKNIYIKFCNANSTHTCIGIQNTVTNQIVAYNKQGKIQNIQDVFFGKGRGIHSGDIFQLKVNTTTGLIQWKVESVFGNQLFDCFCDKLKDKYSQWLCFIRLGPQDSAQFGIIHDLQSQITHF